MTGPVSSSDYHTGTKEQLERGGFALALTDTRLFVSQRTLVTTGNSPEDVTGSHEVLRDLDSAWFFECSPDAFVLVDEQGRIALVNAHIEKMFGYRREELVGEPVEKLIPERFQNDNFENRYIPSPHTRSMGAGLERFGRHRDGHEFPIQITLAPLETEHGVLISSAIRIVTDLERTQELQSSLEFERLISRLLRTFVNLPVESVDSELSSGLKDLAEVLHLDRVSITLTGPQKQGRSVTQSWVRPEVPSASFGKTDEIFHWLASHTSDREICCVSAPEDLPEEAAADRAYMESVGLKSWLTIPLLVGGEQVGSMGISTFSRTQVWDSILISRFQQVADVFANVLVRARADENLRQAFHEIEELKSRLQTENVYLREEVKLEHRHNEVIGNSEGLRRVLKKAEQVAGTDSTVLVLGETGTGKELIARTIHEHSRRKHKVMVKVNCAALPASLVESELFGREKGAFTGALTREIGRFELANGSTIFLDEIGELPIELQSKLLRVLQEGEFERLGSPKTIKVDVRVIAATSRNLQNAVRDGKFREDLFYRLNVFPVTIPPLRERREDIPPLVWHFVNDLGQRMGRSIESVHAATMEAFKNYYWPGNVRELRNVIERFLITSTNTVFRAELPIVETSGADVLSQTSDTVERSHILHILDMTAWRIRGEGGAAQVLGLKPTTLESRMQKLGIARHK
jgi:formate hydrogenlyase transcriptional activator